MWGSKKDKMPSNWEDAAEANQLKKFQPMIELCESRAQIVANVYRSELAGSGRPLTLSAEQIFFNDVYAIVFNFARANGKLSIELRDILLTIGSASVNGHPISDDMNNVKQLQKSNGVTFKIRFWNEWHRSNADLIEQEPDVTVPISVEKLVTFDSQNGTHHAEDAARVFLDFATQVCVSGDANNRESLAYVMDEYTRVLTPYFAKLNDYPGLVDELTRKLEEIGRIADELADCAECVAAYQVLGLEKGASRDEIQSAYKDFTKMFHPDRFPESDQRLRLRAESEFKKVQQAHNHIIEHSRD